MPPHFDPNVHHRHSTRLQGYDYTQGGAYFVTLCTFNQACLFGDIVDGEPRWSDIGEIVEREWRRTPVVQPNVLLDVFVVMPNHIHGIIMLLDTTGIANPGASRKATMRDRGGPDVTSQKATQRVAPTGPAAGSIGAIIGQFRSVATKRIRLTCNVPDITIWHRNYYDYVIRNDRDLERIREYIVNNPARWTEDEHNPTNIHA